VGEISMITVGDFSVVTTISCRAILIRSNQSPLSRELAGQNVVANTAIHPNCRLLKSLRFPDHGGQE